MAQAVRRLGHRAGDRPAGSPERQLAFDMARHALPAAPILVIAGALGWGVKGALSVAFAIALVLANLVLSALSLSWAARVSPGALMATALGGFLARMTLVVIVLAVVRHDTWVARLPLGLTVVLTHLGLVIWESRYVSATLAFPTLKPPRSGV